MTKMTLPPAFIDALPVLEKIEAAGFEAYFVGGSVRDTLLGKPIHDVDIATSAFPAEIKALFDRTVDTGIQHGTVMILDHGVGYEVTTFRTESTYTDFRRPDDVTFVRELREDLKRRDFTINALALRADGELVDLFDGQTDLANGVIRAVGEARERFTEDALRMMRALRFSAQLDFAIEAQTQQALQALAPNLTRISVERIQVELEKLLQASSAKRGWQALVVSGVLAYLPGNVDWLSVADVIAADLKQARLTSVAGVWAYLVVRLGLTRAEISDFLRAWKVSRAVLQTAQAVADFYRTEQRDAWTYYLVAKDAATLLEVLAVWPIVPIEVAKKQLAALPIQDKAELALTGKDIIQAGVLQPGPQLGQTLAQLETDVVLGKVANDYDALMAHVGGKG
ncbi:MAG TPA: CCA tRNA nucleotidyltransferase [Lactobacillaceae bacterium]|jgi:tRNA nucleotidyltransferase (CCA-adding enzyme)